MSTTLTNTALSCFTSEYRHGVDSKRRLQIPAKWRPANGEAILTLILWPSVPPRESFIVALPAEPLSRLLDKFKGMAYSDPRPRLLARNSDQFELDSGGRICLSEFMAKGAGIQTDALLVGNWDRFEIWNPRRFEQAIELDQAVSGDAFKLL